MSNGGRSATTSGARHASEGALHHSNAPSTPHLCRMVNCGQLRLCEVGALVLQCHLCEFCGTLWPLAEREGDDRRADGQPTSELQDHPEVVGASPRAAFSYRKPLHEVRGQTTSVSLP